MTSTDAAVKTTSQPLVTVDNLTKHYRQEGAFSAPQVVRAVEDVSFDIRTGETLGLVGESGCGKSTLGRAILRLHEPTSGKVTIDGVDVTSLAPAALRGFRRRAQMIFQDPFASLNPRMTVGDAIEEPLAIHGLHGNRAGRRARVSQLLDRVGLRPDAAARYPHEFSGGQRQRIGIARALAVEPKFIVADEPISALDVSIQAQIVNLLVALQAESQLTYLFVSHDLKIVRHICDRVAVMYLGRIVEDAPVDALYSQPKHPYTQALLSAVPVPDPERRSTRIVLVGDVPSPTAPPPGCAFHPRCPLYAAKGQPAVCRTERPLLTPTASDSHHRVACHFADDRQPVLA